MPPSPVLEPQRKPTTIERLRSEPPRKAEQVSAQMELDQSLIMATVKHHGKYMEASIALQLTEFQCKLRERVDTQLKVLQENLFTTMRCHEETLKVGFSSIWT